MRKIILIGLAIVLMAGFTYAQDLTVSSVLDKLPDVKQGIAMNLSHDNSKTYSLTSVDLVGWGKGHISQTQDKLFLGGGIATDFNGSNIEVATLSYKIGGLENLGFSYPLAKLLSVEVGVYAGKDFINTGTGKADVCYGLQASLINIKF